MMQKVPTMSCAARARAGVGRQLARMLTLFVLCVLLAACVQHPRGGQVVDEAQVMLSNLDGVSEGRISSTSHYEGFKEATNVFVSVTLEDDFHPQDPQAFLQYLVALGWSVNVNAPNKGITVRLNDREGALIDKERDVGPVDWKRIAMDQDWSIGAAGGSVRVSFEKARERFGSWPGPIPKPPKDASVIPARFVALIDERPA